MPQKFSLDTVAKGENAQALAEFFDKRLAIHTPEMAAENIVDGVAKGHARSPTQGFATEEDYRTDTEDTFVNKK